MSERSIKIISMIFSSLILGIVTPLLSYIFFSLDNKFGLASIAIIAASCGCLASYHYPEKMLWGGLAGGANVLLIKLLNFLF